MDNDTIVNVTALVLTTVAVYIIVSSQRLKPTPVDEELSCYRQTAYIGSERQRTYQISDSDDKWVLPAVSKGRIDFDLTMSKGGLLIALTRDFYLPGRHPYEGYGIVVDDGNPYKPRTYIGKFPSPTFSNPNSEKRALMDGFRLQDGHYTITIDGRKVELYFEGKMLVQSIEEKNAPVMAVKHIAFGSMGGSAGKGTVKSLKISALSE